MIRYQNYIIKMHCLKKYCFDLVAAYNKLMNISHTHGYI